MNDNRVIIGDRLRECRKLNKLTQEEISSLLDISVKHYSEVERGIAGLSIDNWIEVSNILNTTLDYLLKGIEENESVIVNNMFQNITQHEKDTLINIINLVKNYHKD